MAGQPQQYYRIVLTDPPTLADFTSPRAEGRTPRDDDPEVQRLWDGISVYATAAQARNRAWDCPWLGRFVARLTLPAGAPVRVERTLRSRGHHTLWGEPATLLGYVASVVPV